jgi:hypothetical protein
MVHVADALASSFGFGTDIAGNAREIDSDLLEQFEVDAIDRVIASSLNEIEALSKLIS